MPRGKVMQIRALAPIWSETDGSAAFRRYCTEVFEGPRTSSEQSMQLLREFVASRDAFWRTVLASPRRAIDLVQVLRAPPLDGAQPARALIELAAKVDLDNLLRRATKALSCTRRSLSTFARAAELALPAFSWSDPDMVLAEAAVLALADAADVQRAAASLLRARNLAVERNLRLVISVSARVSRVGLSLEDLVAEGNLGLMKAVGRFDPSRGVRFSTYAVWWIRHTVRRAICDQGRLVRLPVHVVETLYRVMATQGILATRFGRPPDDDEVASACGIPVDKVRKLLRAGFFPLSLDAPSRDDDGEVDLPIGSLVPDGAPSAEERIAEDERTELARALVRELEPRRAAIVRARFGLGGVPERTLEDIGVELGVSRERVRQVETHTLRDLRQSVVHRVRRRRLEALAR